MDVSPEEIRKSCPCFRVLIVGRRNAGKTTILEKMTGSDAGVKPEIRDERGELVDDPALLSPGIERGMSRIDYEITYPNNPGFVFHDSRGIEAGAESDERSLLRIEYIRSFIEKRAMRKKLANQLHTIWFCIPMDNPRVPSDSFELAFFNLGTGAVPVIAVLTKYEAFLDRAKSTLKERQGHEPNKKQILSYLDEQIMSNIKRTQYPPAATVQTHHKGEGCNILTEKTYAAIKDQTLAHIFALSQENSMRVSCEETFKNLSRLSILKARQSAFIFACNALVSFPFWRQDASPMYLIILPYSVCSSPMPPRTQLWSRRRRWDEFNDIFSREDTLSEMRDRIAPSTISSAVQKWEKWPSLLLPLSANARTRFVSFALLLACWTSKKSKTPSAYLASSIAHLDAMVDERTRFTNGVDKILKQHSGNHDILFKELAQHVINNADTFIALESTLPSHNSSLGETSNDEEPGTA